MNSKHSLVEIVLPVGPLDLKQRSCRRVPEDGRELRVEGKAEEGVNNALVADPL
jgi:hypothetical protein